jgi:transposase
MRKRYSAAFKAQMVVELLKEEKTVNQLAAEHGVHPTQLRDWKKQAVEGLPRAIASKLTSWCWICDNGLSSIWS